MNVTLIMVVVHTMPTNLLLANFTPTSTPHYHPPFMIFLPPLENLLVIPHGWVIALMQH